MNRKQPGPGQESVWDYPRPPRVEPEDRTVRIVLGGVTIATTNRALRVLETSHPPGIYLPAEAFAQGSLAANANRTVCEWKGVATYWDLNGGGTTRTAAAWSYPKPRPGFEEIAGYISIYPGRVDACYLDDELVRAQEGDFYGGWITDDIVGPFKGGAGTLGW
ncbi:MAG: DUF427 domain-containing protein [Acidimicrobiia bacterium]